MSEIQNAVVKARAASVSDEKFIDTIIEADGQKTNQQIADMLGMKLASFSTRYSTVNTRLAKSGTFLPGLKRRASSTGRAKSKLTPEQVQQKLAKYNESKTVATSAE